jgi:uncharacterized protein YecE (DUF72 family)
VPVLVGTSGWQYKDWKGHLYPPGVAVSRWLEHYARRFQSVEINSTFYRLPARETFEQWRDRTPEDFLFAVKASRYLTHIRWREPAEPVSRLMECAGGLGAKLGPVLLQVRDTLRADVGALEGVLASFPSGVPVAFEPRHESWFTDATFDVLSRHSAALCLTDTPLRQSPAWRTASWGYVRFHQGLGRPRPCYGPTVLRRWAEQLAELWSPEADLYVYFNNDTYGCAVRDARRFALLLADVDLLPTRVPPPRESTVGTPLAPP